MPALQAGARSSMEAIATRIVSKTTVLRTNRDRIGVMHRGYGNHDSQSETTHRKIMCESGSSIRNHQFIEIFRPISNDHCANQ